MSIYGKAIEESCKQNEEVVNESIIGLAVVGLVKLLAGVAAFIVFNVALAVLLLASGDKYAKDRKVAYEKIKPNKKLMSCLEKGFKNVQAFIKVNIKESNKYFKQTQFKFSENSINNLNKNQLRLELELFEIDTIKIFEDIMKVKFEDYVKDRLIKEKYFDAKEDENNFDVDDYFNSADDDFMMGFDKDTKIVKEYMNNIIDKLESLTKSDKNNTIPISFNIWSSYGGDEKFIALDDVYHKCSIYVIFTIKDYETIDPELKEAFKKNGIDIEKEIEEAKNEK